MTHKKVYYPCCRVCGIRFKAHRNDAMTCKGKCRVRWSRETDNKTKRSVNVIPSARMTKSLRVKDVTCSWCNRCLTVTGNNSMRRYCNDACQQAAYRFRKSLIDEWLDR